MQHRAIRFFLQLSVPLLAISGLAAADVLVVGPLGSGADYDQISTAVIAAQDGDQIRVLAGTYTGFNIDKALQIIGEDRDTVLIETFNPFVAATRVFGLEAGEAVHLSGFSANSESGFGNLGVQDCAGVVTIDNVRLGDSENGGLSNLALTVTNSSLVVVTDSILEVFNVPEDEVPIFIGAPPAVQVTDSMVIFEGCELRGGDVPLSGLVLKYKDSWGGLGIEGLRSAIVLSDSSVVGGRGGLSSGATITGRGGAAVEMRQGTLIVTGDSVLRGGAAPAGTAVVTAAGGAAIDAVGNAKLLVDPSNDLAGGLGSVPSVQAAAVKLGPNALQIPQFERFLSFHAASVPGQSGLAVEVEARSEQGVLLLPFVALGATVPVQVPGFEGLSIIDPATAFALPMQTADPSGSTLFQVSTPPTPGLEGLAAVFHGYQLDLVTGVATLGFGSATTLRN